MLHLKQRENHELATLTREIIEAAIAGFEGQKHRIDTRIAELRAMLTGAPAVAAATIPTKGSRGGKRIFSPDAIKRMREAQQRRWAKVRGESAPASKAAPKSNSKRKMSAAGRKAIAEAQKKRWAAKKGGASA
jgi:hypothetical protein